MTDIREAISINDVAKIAGVLSKGQKGALAFLPPPRDAVPHRNMAARPYSSTWRKGSAHWRYMVSLENCLTERKISRGEELWRLTRPLGIAVRAYIFENEK